MTQWATTVALLSVHWAVFEALPTRPLPTVCRVRWFKVRRGCFQWSRHGNWLRSFEEERPNWCIYIYMEGRVLSPLGPRDYSYYCNKDTRFVCSRRKRGLLLLLLLFLLSFLLFLFFFPSLPTARRRNAAIHSVGSREYKRPRRVIKCLHWLNGSSFLYRDFFFFSSLPSTIYRPPTPYIFICLSCRRGRMPLNNDTDFR